METSLANMDLSDLIRRQPVCAVLPRAAPQPLFAELYAAIRELAETLLPGVDLAADTWLFQRLAESLDRRLLSCLVSHELGLGRVRSASICGSLPCFPRNSSSSIMTTAARPQPL